MKDLQLTEESIVVRNDDVLYSEVADGLSLMDMESGRYFHFEPTGAQIWLKLAPDMRFADLCSQLEQEFDVAPEQCRMDTSEFVNELYGLGLVEVA